MTDILSEKMYEPPKVEVLQVQVEVGFYGTSGYTPPFSGGSGGSTTEDDTLYDLGGGSTVQGMPYDPS